MSKVYVIALDKLDFVRWVHDKDNTYIKPNFAYVSSLDALRGLREPKFAITPRGWLRYDIEQILQQLKICYISSDSNVINRLELTRLLYV